MQSSHETDQLSGNADTRSGWPEGSVPQNTHAIRPPSEVSSAGATVGERAEEATIGERAEEAKAAELRRRHQERQARRDAVAALRRNTLWSKLSANFQSSKGGEGPGKSGDTTGSKPNHDAPE